MNRAHLRLTQSQTKPERAKDIKQSQSRFSLTNLKDSFVNYWNRGLAITADFFHNLRTDKSKPNDTKGFTKGANLSGIPCSCPLIRAPSLDSPEPSRDETIDINRTEAVAREERSNRPRASVVGNRNPALQGNEVEKTELGEEPKELRMVTASPAMIVLGELSKEIHERNKKLQDKALAEKKRYMAERRRLAAERRRLAAERRRLAAQKKYQKRYKASVPKTPVVQALGDRYRLKAKEETERRRRNVLTQLSRTAESCGKKRKESEFVWEAEWEKRRTPGVCGTRKREYSFTASLEEPKKKKRKLLEFDWEAEWEKRRTPGVCGKRKWQYSFTASLEEPKKKKRKLRPNN